MRATKRLSEYQDGSEGLSVSQTRAKATGLRFTKERLFMLLHDDGYSQMMELLAHKHVVQNECKTNTRLR